VSAATPPPKLPAHERDAAPSTHAVRAHGVLEAVEQGCAVMPALLERVRQKGSDHHALRRRLGGARQGGPAAHGQRAAGFAG
jgi:hypothetical protein